MSFSFESIKLVLNLSHGTKRFCATAFTPEISEFFTHHSLHEVATTSDGKTKYTFLSNIFSFKIHDLDLTELLFYGIIYIAKTAIRDDGGCDGRKKICGDRP